MAKSKIMHSKFDISDWTDDWLEVVIVKSKLELPDFSDVFRKILQEAIISFFDEA